MLIRVISRRLSTILKSRATAVAVRVRSISNRSQALTPSLRRAISMTKVTSTKIRMARRTSLWFPRFIWRSAVDTICWRRSRGGGIRPTWRSFITGNRHTISVLPSRWLTRSSTSNHSRTRSTCSGRNMRCLDLTLFTASGRDSTSSQSIICSTRWPSTR